MDSICCQRSASNSEANFRKKLDLVVKVLKKHKVQLTTECIVDLVKEIDTNFIALLEN
jgi:hypothetical protein